MCRLTERRLFPAVTALISVIVALSPQHLMSLGQPHFVSSVAKTGTFRLADQNHAASIYLDSNDYPGVIRAAHDLQKDINRVTGREPVLIETVQEPRGEVVLIGSIGRSRLIDELIRDHELDVSTINGKWEATLTQVIQNPMPGVTSALVIAGSDKRGAIFGIYDLSEQIGVSPWYWWADVPVKHQNRLYVDAGSFVRGEPAVKYRGIFLNDEAPALTGWVNANYGGYNHDFYEKVFELLLRLRANYLWPAMWNSAFNEDDPENASLADEYGIVMGTSHHEPMLRAQQEWKQHGNNRWDYSTNGDVLNKFWAEGIERNRNFESTITLGMRGDGDMPMTEGANITLLEKIVADQRGILAEHRTPTLDADPKVWALYKEVQEYYEKGMRVPDDVTLLWCDDNWGNIRRLPTSEERKRSGGAGIYYHFDYVGDPRSYKWINTNPIAKVWEQMNLALAYGADRIWVVNVGDLKPMEFPMEYFLTLARNPERWGKDQTEEFTRMWAEREFGPEHAAEIAELVVRCTRYNGRRKPELLDASTFNLLNYGEADSVVGEWKALVDKAEGVKIKLPVEAQDAFFELVLHPIKASAIVTELYVTSARNHLYAKQGRASANGLAEETRRLFRADAELTKTYNHSLANGKWNHMMDQTHIGYTLWNEPPPNTMPPVTEVQPVSEARMGVAAEGVENPAGPQSLHFDGFEGRSHYVDIFDSGLTPFEYKAPASEPWIRLSSQTGRVTQEERIEVNIDWTLVPDGKAEGVITIIQEPGQSVRVNVEAFHPHAPSRESLTGFVEADGYVSMEAEHYTKMISDGSVHWDRIPDYGPTLSGMTIFPVTALSAGNPAEAARLEYRMYLLDKGSMNLETTIAPTLNFVTGRGLRFAVWLDDQPPQTVDALEHNSDSDWATAVSNGVRRVETRLEVAEPGYHTLHFAMVDPGVVLEKLVLSTGPLKASYLDPPESFRNVPEAIRAVK